MWPWVQSDPVPKQEQRLRGNGFDGAFVRGFVVEQIDVPCTQIDGNEKGARPRILTPWCGSAMVAFRGIV
jgi:hypothetical protein